MSATAKTVESISQAIKYEVDEPPAIAIPSPLFVGIDIAKNAHVAGFVSQALIAERGRYEKCPVLIFPNSRAGFEQLLAAICARCAPSMTTILLEATGHYHKALEQYLLEHGAQLYIMHVRAKPQSYDKSDRRDALSLANTIYNQVARGVQIDDKKRTARLATMPSETALRLHGLVQRRYEISQDINRRENKLTSILDEIFPEFVTCFKDPNLPTALSIREAFPTPAEYAAAQPAALIALKKGARPGKVALIALQRHAAESIGTRIQARIECLILEQSQIIKELRLLQAHLAVLDAQIATIVQASREGQILLSIPAVGMQLASVFLAMVDSVTRFESDAKLKRFCGWAPNDEQTGISRDNRYLPQGGSRLIKKQVYLAVLNAIRMSGPWQVYYLRLVERKCSYDERLKKWHGKMKVIGHVAGRMVEMMYRLLSIDAARLSSVPPGAELPEPQLYDAARHLRDMQRGQRARRGQHV